MRYHYLTHNLNKGAKGFGLFNEKNEIVACCFYIHFPHLIKNLKLISRIVVLPDYQGIGLGKKLLEFTANYLGNLGFYTYIKTSAINMIISLNKDKKWICNSFGHSGPNTKAELNKTLSDKRKTASFRYIGENNEFLKI